MPHYHVKFDYDDDDECAEDDALTENEIKGHIEYVLSRPFKIKLTNFTVVRINKTKEKEN